LSVTTTTPRQAAPPTLVNQLVRFVLIGGFSALVDYGTYQLLLSLGTWVHLAKGLSFIAGTTTAYLLNRRWTFRAPGSKGRFAAFILLYATTFCVNVGMNALALHLLADGRWKITIAFIIAQGTATTINFIVMRALIFRH
jgi:putative flippase GtrA